MRARIAAACEAVSRDVSSVTLIAVTKTYPASDVLTLARLGVLDIGESKDQEARAKLAELAEMAAFAEMTEPAELRWHLVGRLQTNKARSVATYAHAVHSVDRPKLASALADAVESATRSGRRTAGPLQVFVQISLDGDPQRGGVPEDGLAELCDLVAEREQLRLCGVMAVAPIDADADAAFAKLAELSERVRGAHPEAGAISAGMSGDLEAAIRHGSTHVRVGTALLGRRGPTFS